MAASRELLVTARVGGAVFIPDELPMFDGLLAWAVCQRDNIPPALTAAEAREIEIPAQRSACGRVWLCSQGHAEVEAAELRYTNRRPPIEQFQALAGRKMTRVDIATGANKGYRIPRHVTYLRDDRVDWWCIGDADEIRALLDLVTHVGKKRSVGCGRVVSWSVEPCESWPGFPVLRDGLPLRPLPLDYPGLGEGARTMYRTLAPPYWSHAREELCAVPH